MIRLSSYGLMPDYNNKLTYRDIERMASYAAYATSSKMTSFFAVIGKNCWDVHILD